VPRTPLATLIRARTIAMDAGLHYVYTGNVEYREGDATVCPTCGARVIERDWYDLVGYRLTRDGRCAKVRDADPRPLRPQARPLRCPPVAPSACPPEVVGNSRRRVGHGVAPRGAARGRDAPAPQLRRGVLSPRAAPDVGCRQRCGHLGAVAGPPGRTGRVCVAATRPPSPRSCRWRPAGRPSRGRSGQCGASGRSAWFSAAGFHQGSRMNT